MSKLTPKQKVLKEWPSAFFDRDTREIQLYTQGIVLGRGSVIARSIEASAWKDAAANLQVSKERGMNKPYTEVLLKRFDRLTAKLSARNQLARIEARIDVKRFEDKYGSEVCQAMFEVLRQRDKKKESR